MSLPPASVLPSPCTVRQAVTTYFDIQAIPRRHFFELLVHFTTDETEREKFEEFDTAEGQQVGMMIIMMVMMMVIMMVW